MTEPERPELRASDIDRELVASQLRRHATAGRLTMSELDERLKWAYAAKTHGDLAKLTSDLPLLSAEPAVAEEAASGRLVYREQRRADRARRRGTSQPVAGRKHGGVVGWGSYLSVNLLLIVIWALTMVDGASVYPWWLWVAGPWGAVLLAEEIQSRSRRL